MHARISSIASASQQVFATGQGITFNQLEIETESLFSWRGEYLGELDSGMMELHVFINLEGEGMNAIKIAEITRVKPAATRSAALFAPRSRCVRQFAQPT